MNRINLFRKNDFDKTASTLVFAALLIVCSVAVGCSSDKPQPASSTSQVAMTQPPAPIETSPASTPTAPVAAPVHQKVVRKAPVN